MCQAAMLLFFAMLYSDNFLGLLAAFALLGLCMLPMLPAVVENCAECTYPLPEELSTGILFVGGNIMGIPFIFIVQVSGSTKLFSSSSPTSCFYVLFFFLLQCALSQYFLSGSDGSGPPPFNNSNYFIEAVMIFTVVVLMFYNGKLTIRPSPFSADLTSISVCWQVNTSGCSATSCRLRIGSQGCCGTRRSRGTHSRFLLNILPFTQLSSFPSRICVIIISCHMTNRSIRLLLHDTYVGM